MKKYLLILPLVLLTGCFGGTSRVVFSPAYEGQTAVKDAKVVANVTAFNRGVFLFNLIPIWSGSPVMPNNRRYHLFKNRVREGYNVMMMENYLSQEGADDLVDIESQYHSTGAYSLWILWNRSMRTTAVAVKYPKKK